MIGMKNNKNVRKCQRFNSKQQKVHSLYIVCVDCTVLFLEGVFFLSFVGRLAGERTHCTACNTAQHFSATVAIENECVFQIVRWLRRNNQLFVLFFHVWFRGTCIQNRPAEGADILRTFSLPFRGKGCKKLQCVLLLLLFW